MRAHLQHEMNLGEDLAKAGAATAAAHAESQSAGWLARATGLAEQFVINHVDLPSFQAIELRAYAEANGLPSSFAQDNQSRSRPGVIRGLHFQRAPHGQGKLVSVARGAVWDVAVDLRPGSPTFARWLAVELQAGDGRALWIPEGFGHGFCVLGDEDAVLTYKCTREYHAASDGGVAYNEPAFGITWPVTGTPIVSDKDRTLPSLAELGLG